ncbi:MAG TPA: PP2C family serine/threonine-protein phosphatase [Streptosporangiaceae bacterium]|jgi:PPM family protein phosphatase|nr:PP2C family serine/threonine-protein phosphatase [Streptosporangiaceae bacterium]
MTIALRYVVRSDVGLLREGNEDSAYAGPHLLAIADGMGGHAAGEVASAVAIKTLAPLDADTTGVDMLAVLGEAIADANAALRLITQADPATEGMGTTVTALLWHGHLVAICHIGDSRGYLLRDGALQQITHDHTLVQSLVDEGRLTREAAASHPQRSLVMRALQSSIPADPDLELLEARVGDRFLLCSDGLTDVVTDETLRMTLSELTDLDAAVDQLVDLAIRSGGPDNITCVLADVVDTDDGGEASLQAIMVGALTAGDEEFGEPNRSDSPAARAHQLAQAIQQAEHEADLAAGGSGGSSTRVSTAAPVPTPIQEPTTEPAPGAQAPAGVAGPDEDLEEDDEDSPRRRSSRRRWPVVTCVLLLLVSVVGVAGYFGWRLTQSQYYVGTDRGNVVVFRGVSQSVAGMSLSRVVRRTNIPLSALPSSEVGSIRLTIGPEASLKEALRIISQFRQDYKCAVVQASIVEWVAHRPKPAPPKHHTKTKSGKAQSGKSKTRARHPAPKRTTTVAPSHSPTPTPTPTPVKPANTSKSTGTTTHSPASQNGTSDHSGPTKTSTSKTTHRKANTSKKRKTSKPHSVNKVKYPPEPVLPAFCPAFTGASG